MSVTAITGPMQPPIRHRRRSGAAAVDGASDAGRGIPASVRYTGRATDNVGPLRSGPTLTPEPARVETADPAADDPRGRIAAG